MIEGLTTKRAQLRDGFFQTGTGPETLLLVGSCRTLSYLNYLHRWNRENGNRFRIARIDPTDFWYNERDELMDLSAFETAMITRETDHRILELLRSATIFIHEWYKYYGMFNTAKGLEKNVYHFGLNPQVDVCLPNFHDKFVLFTDLLHFDEYLRRRFLADGLTPDLAASIKDRGLANLDKFYDICQMTSFPEFADFFKEQWTRKRFFWTGNHVSGHFTWQLFRLLNDRFLNLPLSDSFCREAAVEDQFRNPHTPVTQADRDSYGITWNEPTLPLTL